jgi:hypothetical protein
MFFCLEVPNFYQQQGEFQEAGRLYRQAMKIAEAKLGLNHPTTQTIRNHLNSLLESL